jgi:hypothetical protein
LSLVRRYSGLARAILRIAQDDTKTSMSFFVLAFKKDPMRKLISKKRPVGGWPKGET